MSACVSHQRVGSREPRTGARVRQARGFILIPVIFTLALLALVALTITRTVSLDIKANTRQLRSAEAEMLADGVARLVIQHLMLVRSAPPETRILKPDGSVFACRLGARTAIITAQDTAGQIDLNAASQELLERLLAGIAVPKDQAARLAAAIVDFRDPDDLPLPGGAEAADYRAAGLGHGPKNAPFAIVGELDQVLGMTPDLLARVRPLVTVHSRVPGVDQTVAAAPVRGLTLPNTMLAVSPARAFLIRVTVQNTGTAQFARETVVELSPRAPLGHLVRVWARGDATLASPPIGDLPSCIDALLTPAR